MRGRRERERERESEVLRMNKYQPTPQPRALLGLFQQMRLKLALEGLQQQPKMAKC